MLYPFPWVNHPQRKIAGAAGGFMLLRFAALERIGGLNCIRSALIDDCALGAAVKAGGRIWLGLANPLSHQPPGYSEEPLQLPSNPSNIPVDTAISLRAYPHLKTIWDMVARTAYTQLHYSGWLLSGTVLGMVLVYLAGPVGLVWGLATSHWMLAGLGGSCWGVMALAYWPTLKLYRCPPILSLALPLIALLYTLMTIDSALRHWRGQGGAWKGRVYPAAE